MAGTAHRFQGSERDVLVLDVPDARGRSRAGTFLAARDAAETGARLFNVAISRAREHLIVIADLEHLRRTLPKGAILTDLLRQAAITGARIDALDWLDWLDWLEGQGAEPEGAHARDLPSGLERAVSAAASSMLPPISPMTTTASVRLS